MIVIKRDNTQEQYDINKIEKVIILAFKNSNTVCRDVKGIINFIDRELTGNDSINIEDIQNIVEKTLMIYKYYDTAKHYINYRNEHDKYRKTHSYISKISDDVKTPWGMLGYITYKRTYARRLNEDIDDNNDTEEYRDTILRVLDACQKQLKIGFTNKELKNAYYYLMSLKCSVAGRFLWQLGTDTVNKLGLMSLQNCAFTVIDEPIKPFTWIFDVLMLGTGVGFNIQRENIDKLPKLCDVDVKITRQDTKDADFIVPDSREGWVSLLEKVLEAFFYKGKSFSYSTILIRTAGAKIKGFGGTASGPEDLVKGINNIQSILIKRKGSKLTSVDCLDIVNIIASVVVAGNVRRSALLSLGDYDDIEYLKAKDWSSGNIPNWRCMSNNSVVCDDVSKLPNEFWEGYNGTSEPYGLINIELSRKIGRIKDGDKYPDPDVKGYNPCCEQNLSDKETCCLGEIFLPSCTSYEELKDVAVTSYRICKHSLLLKCHQKDTEDIVHKNLRMGIGITGFMQSTEEQKGWLSPLYEYLREYDVEYSKKHNIPTSIKLTTVKPSGTLSLLAGVTSGCHPGIYQYFIRRIRISSNSNLIPLCKSKGYFVEYQRNFDGTNDNNTMIVEFPCMYPIGTKLAKDMTAIDQLEMVKFLQTNWSDNAVSCTIYYRLEELDSVKQWLKDNFRDNVKSCSFLLHNEHGFKQAPFEEITKEKYEELIKKVVPITSGNIAMDNDTDYSAECPGGVCPIK
jgi:adenosylcobalamin-dependent ribonucleoside-triphosphate reductase